MSMNNLRLILCNPKKLHVFLYLLVYSVCLSFAFDDNARNLLLIAFMLFSILTIFLYRIFYIYDILLIFFVVFLFSFPLIFHPEETRWSTIFYSTIFCFSFAIFLRAFYSSGFDQVNFLYTIKLIIYLYFSVLLIQQLSILLGISPINLRNYISSEPFKLNSLGAEPSWSARIMALLFYAFITVKESYDGGKYSFKSNFKADKFIWAAFLWSMITMFSGTAFVFLSFVALRFIKGRAILTASLLIVIFIFISDYNNFTPYERAKVTLLSTLTLDEEKIIEADHSASFRIVPLIRLYKSVGLSSLEDYTGHGVDSVEKDISFNLGANVGSTTFLGIWYEYGFIPFLIFMVFTLKLCVDYYNPVSFIFWFMLVFSYGLNTQIPWLAIMILFLVKSYFRRCRYV